MLEPVVQPVVQRTNAPGHRPNRRSLGVVVALILAVSAANAWWSRHQQRGVGAQVAQLAAPGDVRMLASDTCALCAAARAWLQTHQVVFAECSIERDAACQQAFVASLSPGTPVLLVRGQVLVGFDAAQLLKALERGAKPR
jgi:glutaredoxin